MFVQCSLHFSIDFSTRVFVGALIKNQFVIAQYPQCVGTHHNPINPVRFVGPLSFRGVPVNTAPRTAPVRVITAASTGSNPDSNSIHTVPRSMVAEVKSTLGGQRLSFLFVFVNRRRLVWDILGGWVQNKTGNFLVAVLNRKGTPFELKSSPFTVIFILSGANS